VDSRRILRLGEVWQANLDPTVGHEQGEARPVIIVSDDQLNEGPSRIALVVPLTRKYRGIPFLVEVTPTAGGLKHRSFALCEMIRSISTDRARYRIGVVDESIMVEIGYRLRVLLGL
jgi:mRNA interferase MazF